ncbi:hypothetical protein [Arthrobacter sp. NEB 688]|uniref:hypothetical protein n=1 Tax=Arthrobacter sp. NEB 688 TaxID=904039 RepID=UPI0015639193|nr:hypothetical protein [Arthrobacter sp. NEB 688]QKE82703.1 hypothetical protein HL663_01190 [Arthrobacter sp. NEB 688]
MTTRAASALRLAGLAAATLTVSACGVFSPVQTDYPYIPADGVDLTLPGLDLRNIAIVSAEEGAAGTLIGQAVNNAAEPVEISFSIEGGQAATTSLPAYSGEGLADAKVRLEAVPVAPGAMVQLTVATREGGQNLVLVPVLSPELYYEGLAPSPSATTSPSATPTATPSPTAS